VYEASTSLCDDVAPASPESDGFNWRSKNRVWVTSLQNEAEWNNEWWSCRLRQKPTRIGPSTL